MPSFTRSRATFATNIEKEISGECWPLAFPYRIRQSFDRSFAMVTIFGAWYGLPLQVCLLWKANRTVVPVTDHLRNREGFSRQILEDRGRGRGLRGLVVKYRPYRSTTGLLTRQPRLALAPKKLANLSILSRHSVTQRRRIVRRTWQHSARLVVLSSPRLFPTTKASAPPSYTRQLFETSKNRS